MKVLQHEAMQSYHNAMGFSSKVNEYLQKFKQRFAGVNVSVGIPNSSHIFEEKGNNHLMIPNNILQKVLKDSDYASLIEEDFRIFEKQMKRDHENPTVKSSGFFVNLDGSYGAWSIVEHVAPYDSSDTLRRDQQSKQESLNEMLVMQDQALPKGPQRIFSKKVVIENGEINEKETSMKGRVLPVQHSLELWA